MESTSKLRNSVTIFIRDLNDPVFAQALEKIDNSTCLTGDKAWLFADFIALCDEHHQRAKAAYKQLLFKCVETEAILAPDDTGAMLPTFDPQGIELHRLKVLRDDQGKVKDYIFKDQDAFKEGWDELLGQHFTTEIMTLTNEEVTAIGLTPKELRAIRILVKDAPLFTHDPVNPEVYSS